MSSNKPSQGRIAFKGKATLMKELQRTIAFRCYNDLLTSGGSKSQKELKSIAHRKYFGNPNDTDSLGYAAQLNSGVNSFAVLFS